MERTPAENERLKKTPGVCCWLPLNSADCAARGELARHAARSHRPPQSDDAGYSYILLFAVHNYISRTVQRSGTDAHSLARGPKLAFKGEGGPFQIKFMYLKLAL